MKFTGFEFATDAELKRDIDIYHHQYERTGKQRFRLILLRALLERQRRRNDLSKR